MAQGNDRQYAIDVRIFLALITTGMALAFGLGVAFGPTPEVKSFVGEEGGVEQQQGPQQRSLPRVHSAEVGDRVKVEKGHMNISEVASSGREDLEGLDTYDNVTATAPGDEHLPQGQHLLVDIKGIEHDFLNSEERLARAMVDVVDVAGLTLLSYHCHALHPKGVSCVGVLLESHISFHTWPDEGVITLDLFTCGNNPLLPVVPVIERLFGIPRILTNSHGQQQQDKIRTLWSHELRGFRRAEDRKAHYLDDNSDLASWVVSPLDNIVKKQIVSVNSPYQRIDIWDVVNVEDVPSHQDGLRLGLKEGDPRWLSAEYASPDRMLFLDGKLQIMSESEHEYHESLVHPAMFSHPGPKRVAIVGGGEGAALREVLKHRTVETAKMIEIDEMMVGICRENLPSMSDCSDIEGSTASCFDDPRTSVLYEDGRRWFIDNYGPNVKISPENKFDVVFIDALNPEDDRVISNDLYTDTAFISAILDSLNEDGVIGISIGAAPSIHDPKPDIGVTARREQLFNLLESNPSTAAMFVYEEPHCGSEIPRSFLVACKSVDCRKRWYAEADAVDYWIYDRIALSKSSTPPLSHYDGSTQRSFHVPPKAWETVYCRREPEPFECAYRGLDTTKKIFEFRWDEDDWEEKSDFKIVSKESTGEQEYPETSVFAKVDIPKGSYIMPSDLAASFVVSDETISNLRQTSVAGSVTGPVFVIDDFLEFIDENRHSSIAAGAGKSFVEIGGSFLIRWVDDASEANLERWMPNHPSGKLPTYSPVYERNLLSFDLFLVASRDIKAGEELLKHDDVWA